MADSRTTYDDVRYPSAVYPQTHPDRLCALAKLFGMKPAPLDSCRVLELGCGDGLNLIAMAVAMPQAHFTGIDLAALPVAQGQVIVRRLGLSNVSLLAKDVMKANSEWGQFDFIIAHGLYSWVPDAVRERILSLCAQCLAPQGVAYVSYNAQPGNHLREIARGLMRFHTTQSGPAEDRIRQAGAILNFMAENEAGGPVYRDVLRQELKRIGQYPPAALFHDDLSEFNRAFYFHEFTAAAARHGLQYLTEADITDTQADGLSPESTRLLNRFGPEHVLVREQYLDFFRARAFRQTLLCRGDIQLVRAPEPERVFDLFVAATARPVAEKFDLASGEALEFRAANNAVIATQSPVIKAALHYLGGIWPKRISFPELLDRAASLSGESAENNRPGLARLLVATHAIGFVDLHTVAGAFTTEVSAMPCASPLARLQLETGNKAPTLRHTVMQLDGNLIRRLVQLLDGSRSHAQLAAALASGVAPAASLEAEREELHRKILAELDVNLERLARGALLMR
jgi:SAM-dependent methyltransferase